MNKQLADIHKEGAMGTFQNRNKRFFRVNLGLSLSIPILVIAFTIKSVQAFEGKSDILRQVLRQQKLISAVNHGKPLPDNLKRHDIFVAPNLVGRKDIGSSEAIESIVVQAMIWIKENQHKIRVYVILIPSLFGESDLDGSEEQPMPEENFLPMGGVILYKEKK
ncbi:MAG: hypothetical protein V1690_03600 [Candidatus Moraniibacteriota bacterium]